MKRDTAVRNSKVVLDLQVSLRGTTEVNEGEYEGGTKFERSRFDPIKGHPSDAGISWKKYRSRGFGDVEVFRFPMAVLFRVAKGTGGPYFLPLLFSWFGTFQWRFDGCNLEV